jgi:hypothetical protein
MRKESTNAESLTGTLACAGGAPLGLRDRRLCLPQALLPVAKAGW